MIAFIPGFLASLGLIVAIGAQNAFVIRQGLTKKHVLLVVAICAAADATLITLGIAGLGAVIEATIADEIAGRAVDTIYLGCHTETGQEH